MNKLILIRHSNAETGSFNMSDFERELTRKGVMRAEYQANELKIRGIMPDLVITSSATRAVQTTNVFVSKFERDCVMKKEPFLY